MKISKYNFNNETKKLSLIIGLIILSIFIGIFERIDSASTSAASVIPKSSVMVIPIEGMISGMGSQWEGSMVDIFMEQLQEAKDSKSVKAVVLRINSPGGTVGASQEMYDAVERFKAQSKKPVVVSIMDVGASGAYWVALAADQIFAHPGSIVGSLGVITQTFDLTQVPNKYGIDVITYKSGKHKDLLNPWRKPTKEDKNLIYKMLNTVHAQFYNKLVENRKIPLKQAKAISDGRIFSGQDALDELLIDQLGGLYDAIQYAGGLVNIDDPKVVYPNRGFKNWFQSFRAMAHSLLQVTPSSISSFGMQ